MAAMLRSFRTKYLQRLSFRCINYSRWGEKRMISYEIFQSSRYSGSFLKLFGLTSLSGAVLWLGCSFMKKKVNLVPQLRAKQQNDDSEKELKPSIKEVRYRDFSSCSYKGEVYLTAQDMLEAVTQATPRQYSVHYLDDSTLAKMLKATPPRSKGSKRLFRDMWDNGLLSYGDYLFLLSILTKPTSQFEVAFKLMDKDGSDFIDKEEFQQMKERVTTQRKLPWLQQGRIEETSLVRHFFGSKGRDKLYSKDFFKFIEDFQAEVREIEFYRHSKGMPTVTEEDFANILLRHTSTKMSEVHQRLQMRKSPDCKGITFEQFNTFCQLLDNLDNFSTALAIHNLSGLPVTQDEFKRAAYISIGQQLDPVIVTAVFNIFDVDGDGKLSYTEFIHVMKSWSKRSSLLHEGKKEGPWQQFKTCVRLEMTKN